ncbi:helix-turn-helix transcriptional regulator [Knoellia aerolata]|uniref:HTH luxR-type domain-containing protein n=1 Tax=Knoellia aerolata DSM 18566 TaxID=1385519 RepID=A0A0A0K1F8_9MICO|nr:LuxR family transcriptional regulator [Knoellia aerolata]KGN41621.1 hypothetical protein N801_18520 [Knoellia aerolata DSM 18566]
MASGNERHVVGREAELTALTTCLQHAAEGHSRTLVVTGTPGIGKTSLVRQSIAEAADRFLVLSGTCLPLQSLSVPLQPLRSALRESPAPDRGGYLASMEVVDQAPRALDAYVDDVCATTPVVLFVDDIHWADQSTLDVLLYLAAGPSNRALALVVAARDDVLPDGHPLHRWLADVQRLPGVDTVHVGPLDRHGTEQQLMSLMGVAPHQSLVDDVFDKGGGVPYCTSLLVRGVPTDARGLPDRPSADLKAAVKRDWHELSESARNVTSLVAAAGGPVTAGLLLAVADDLGVGEVVPSLEEAVARRVLRLEEPAGYWFHHPLQAEVLDADLGATRSRLWHAAYARQLEATVGEEPSLSTAMALSDHHQQAGNEPAAYAWAMRAWQVAGATRASPELRRLLRRAIGLRPGVQQAAESREDLLELLRSTAEDAGAFGDQLEAVDALLAGVDEQAQPLEAGWLHVQRSRLHTLTGAGTPSPAEARTAVELTRSDPSSWQHAFAEAELARTMVWAAEPGADEHARRALTIARDCGSSRALAFALCASAMVALVRGSPVTATRHAREAGRVALEAGDWHGFEHAVTWQVNAARPPVGEAVADALRGARHELTAAGAPHVFVAMTASLEAEQRLLMGDWECSRDLLRISLGSSDPGPFVDIRSRLSAAMLDAFQGRPRQAAMQLERATELLAGPGAHPNVAVATASALVALASGDPANAVRAAVAGARAPGAAPHLCEWLVPLAARALADLAEAGRLPGEGGAEPRDIDDLVREFPTIVVDLGENLEEQPQLRAMQDWYDAEVARARASADTGDRWWDVAESCEAAVQPWVAVYAWWRAAESLLAQGPTQRRRGIEAWRRAEHLARHLDARSILDEVATLGRIARVPRSPRTSTSADVAVPLPGLTTREREILAHVVEGSTYSEIAASLVISEKTVSSHVSSLLRKTGTANRVELSRLVTRLSSDPDGRDAEAVSG